MSGISQSLLLVLLLLLSWSDSPAVAQSHPADPLSPTKALGPVRLEFARPAIGPNYRNGAPMEAAPLDFEELSSQRSASIAPAHPLLITAGASLGGLIGTVAGSQFQEDCETRCINARGMLGPIVANTALIPLGAHAFDRGRGDLLTSALVSAGWGAAAVAVAGLTDQTWPIWAALPGQVISSTLIEWHCTAARTVPIRAMT